MKRFIRAVLPAFLLAVSVGQIYAFTNFSDGIASYISTAEAPVTKAQVQFAFSLGIFFLGMGAAFFGKIVEKALSSDYKFAEKPETRRFFMDLQQTFIDWNDKPMSAPEFATLKSALLSKISAAAK